MIRFTVYGKPVPQGSMKPFFNKHLGHAILQDGNKNLKPWRQMVSETAGSLGVAPFAEGVPLHVELDFFLEKPKSASRKRIRPVVKPDEDKLVRAIFDGCKGFLYKDDAQIVGQRSDKWYGIPERVEITITEDRREFPETRS